MSKFIGELITRSLGKDELVAHGSPEVQLYELMETFSYQSDKLGYTIVCPKGLTTNFASIPRFVENILPNNHPFIEMPSVPHDFMYALKGQMPDGRMITREEADSVIREGMELQGAPGWMRQAVYQALRFGGGSAWKNAKIDR